MNWRPLVGFLLGGALLAVALVVYASADAVARTLGGLGLMGLLLIVLAHLPVEA